MKFAKFLCVFLVYVSFLHNPAQAESESDTNWQSLNERALTLFRNQMHDEALALMKEALSVTKEGSRERLTVLNNIAVILIKKGSRSEVWQANREVALLRSKLDGTPIPPQFNAATEQDAIEKILTEAIARAKTSAQRYEARMELLRFYETLGMREKANDFLLSIPINKDDSAVDLGKLEEHFATWCKEKDFTLEAQIHFKRSKECMLSVRQKTASVRPITQKPIAAPTAKLSKEKEQYIAMCIAKALNENPVEPGPFDTYTFTGKHKELTCEGVNILMRMIATYKKTRPLAFLLSGHEQKEAKALSVYAYEDLMEQIQTTLVRANEAFEQKQYDVANYATIAALKGFSLVRPEDRKGAFEASCLYHQIKVKMEQILDSKSSKFK